MAPQKLATTAVAVSNPTQSIDPAQTLRAATALLRKIQADRESHSTTASKQDLLATADQDEAEDGTPVWLIVTTKKHITDKKRLKPGKILLPHPPLDAAAHPRICLITADPQRKYKDLIADPTFPLELSKHIGRVIGATKLKAKYKSFESRRQLLSEYDVFLADDRIITGLPQLLGKVFYQKGSKRPIPVTLQGKRQSVDEQGKKRLKLSEGGSKVVKFDVQPAEIAREIQRALSCALVHLAPSTTTAVRVGKASMPPQQLQENVQAVTAAMVDKFVPQKWRNVKAIHIKGPNTAALPIWLADELWEDEADVRDEPLPVKDSKQDKKRKRALMEAAAGPDVIEVPGPDGKMRKVAKPSLEQTNEAAAQQAAERAEKETRQAALKKQKAALKSAQNGIAATTNVQPVLSGGLTGGKKARSKLVSA